MSRRRSIRRPPASAEYVVGELFELKPEDDRVNAGKPLPPPVELVPVDPSAPAAGVFELLPEDDRVANPKPPAGDAKKPGRKKPKRPPGG